MAHAVAIKQDKTYKWICGETLMGRFQPETPWHFIHAFLISHQLQHIDEYIGMSLYDAFHSCDKNVTVAEVVNLIQNCTGEEEVDVTLYNAFMRLTIFGDGACPDCGGDLWYDGDDFYHCTECKEKIESFNELEAINLI